MEFPEMPVNYSNWKTFAVFGVIIAFVVILIYMMFTASPINIYFEKNGIEANSETNLIVDVTNSLGKDISKLTVSVTPVDPNSITVENPLQEEEMVGKGEKRVFKFPVTIGNVRPGTYSVEAKIKMGSESFDKRVMIEVK